MSDNEVVKEQVGSIRTVAGPRGVDTGTQYKLADGREMALFAGTTGSNYIFGSSGADLIVPNGADGKRFDKLAPRDVIDADKGNDTVVLSGKSSDWKSRLPGVIDYPEALHGEFWQDSPKGAYGRSVVLENVATKNIVVLRDVETVVFADGKLSFEAGSLPGTAQPALKPEHVAELDKAIKSGDVKAVPTKILGALAEVGASADDLANAKAQATLEAQKKFERLPTSDRIGGNQYEIGKQIGDEILKKAAPADAPGAPSVAPGLTTPKV